MMHVAVAALFSVFRLGYKLKPSMCLVAEAEKGYLLTYYDQIKVKSPSSFSVSILGDTEEGEAQVQ